MYNSRPKWIHPAVAALLPTDWYNAEQQVVDMVSDVYARRRLALVLQGEKDGKWPRCEREHNLSDYTPERSNVVRAIRLTGLMVSPWDHPGYYWQFGETEREACCAIIREHFHQLPNEEWEHQTYGVPWWTPKTADRTIYNAACADVDVGRVRRQMESA